MPINVLMIKAAVKCSGEYMALQASFQQRADVYGYCILEVIILLSQVDSNNTFLKIIKYVKILHQNQTSLLLAFGIFPTHRNDPSSKALTFISV